MELVDLLKLTVQKKGSDLLIAAGVPPVVRVDGDLERTDFPVRPLSVSKDAPWKSSRWISPSRTRAPTSPQEPTFPGMSAAPWRPPSPDRVPFRHRK